MWGVTPFPQCSDPLALELLGDRDGAGVGGTEVCACLWAVCVCRCTETTVHVVFAWVHWSSCAHCICMVTLLRKCTSFPIPAA